MGFAPKKKNNETQNIPYSWKSTLDISYSVSLFKGCNAHIFKDCIIEEHPHKCLSES